MPSIQEKLAIITTANSMEKHKDTGATSPTNLSTSPDNLPTSPDNLSTNPDDLLTNPDDLPKKSDDLPKNPDSLSQKLDNLTINPDNLPTVADYPSRDPKVQSSSPALPQEPPNIPTTITAFKLADSSPKILHRKPSNDCCQDARREAELLEQQKLQLELELERLERAGVEQGERFNRRLQEADRCHGRRLEQIKEIITGQRRVGDRWKEDMLGLTNKFDTKVKEATYQNKQLRSKIDALNQVLALRKTEAEEATELMGIYSGKIKKVNDTLKRESNRSDESYIEITLPMPFGVL